MARLTLDQGVIWFVGDVTFTEDGLGAAALSAMHADLGAAQALAQLSSFSVGCRRREQTTCLLACTPPPVGSQTP